MPSSSSSSDPCEDYTAGKFHAGAYVGKSGLQGVRANIDTKDPTLWGENEGCAYSAKSVVYIGSLNSGNLAIKWWSVGYEIVRSAGAEGHESPRAYMEVKWGTGAGEFYRSNLGDGPVVSGDPGNVFEIEHDSVNGTVTAKYNGSTWMGSTVTNDGLKGWLPDIILATAEVQPMESHVAGTNGTTANRCDIFNIEAKVGGNWGVDPGFSSGTNFYSPESPPNLEDDAGVNREDDDHVQVWDKR